MPSFKPAYLLFGLLSLPLVTPAAAQSTEENKGVYAVARGGATIGTRQKLEDTFSTFQDKTKYKVGVTGEIGAGYRFGTFRLEQTIGYSSSNLNIDKVNVDGFSGDGRSKMFTMSVNGYVDIPVSRIVVPYIGGGLGLARVDAKVARIDTLNGNSSSYSGKDYGLLMHADAGIGVHVAPKTTVEIGGRYTRVSKLSFDGQTNGVDTLYKPKLSSISAMVGVRYAF